VITLKIFGSCLVLVTLAAVLVLPHWPTADASTGKMRSLATKSQERILLAPSLIIYSHIKLLELLQEEPSLDPELLEIEASSPTPEDMI
jgi:hypothetical protein